MQWVDLSSPAKIAACLAGACPIPADSTFPIITSSISDASILERLIASLIAEAPRYDADNFESLPKNEPKGVLA